MNIRTLLPLLAASVAFPLTVVQAESPAPTTESSEQKASPKKWNPEEMQQKRLDKMAEKLSLTSEQKEKIAALQKEQLPAFKEIKSDTSLTKEAKHEKMKALKESMDSKIEGVLTPEQKAKWAEKKEKMKPQSEKGDKAKPAPAN